MKSRTEYARGSKVLHWVVALMVMCMLSVSFFLDDLTQNIKPTAIMLHKSFGLTVLFLMIIRIVWIIRKGKPALPAITPLWERYLSHIVQHSLYLLLLLMPLCGWVMSVAADHTPSFFGLFELPLPWITPSKALASWMFNAHQTIAWVIIALLVLHIAGAAKHYFIDKDKVVQRMV